MEWAILMMMDFHVPLLSFAGCMLVLQLGMLCLSTLATFAIISSSRKTQAIHDSIDNTMEYDDEIPINFEAIPPFTLSISISRNSKRLQDVGDRISWTLRPPISQEEQRRKFKERYLGVKDLQR